MIKVAMETLVQFFGVWKCQREGTWKHGREGVYKFTIQKKKKNYMGTNCNFNLVAII